VKPYTSDVLTCEVEVPRGHLSVRMGKSMMPCCGTPGALKPMDLCNQGGTLRCDISSASMSDQSFRRITLHGRNPELD
jgi:hypothetical protein